MEIQDLVNLYKSKVSESEVLVNNLFSAYDEDLIEITFTTNILCEKLKGLGLTLSVTDNIKALTQELKEIHELAKFLHQGYEKIVNIDTENIENFIEGYLENKNFINQLPAVQSKIINEMKSTLKVQFENLLGRLKSEWNKEINFSENTIVIGKNIGKIKKHFEALGVWNEIKFKLNEKVLQTFEVIYNRKVQVKIRTNFTKLKITNEDLGEFSNISFNIEILLEFFKCFLDFDSEVKLKISEIIEKFIESQAIICAKNPSRKKSVLSDLEGLEKKLEKFGIGPNKNFKEIIEKCEEISVVIGKNMLLAELRDLLLEPFSGEINVKGEISITNATYKYVETMKKYFRSFASTEFQQFTVLSTLRDAVVLYKALRNLQISANIQEILYFCSDFEYFLQEINHIQGQNTHFPVHLHFLMDYSDIIPLFQQSLEEYYNKIYENNKILLLEKTQLFNFQEFEEKITYHEAILISSLNLIRKNPSKGVVPKRQYFIIMGKLIDDLIFHTISNILSLKDIFIKEINLIKHFFDKIFDVKDIFEGESPVDYCKQWERLEALLEIIQGRLIDIVTLYESKKLQNLFSSRQVRKLIKALFEDSEKRKNALKKIT